MASPDLVTAKLYYFEPPKDGSKPYVYINGSATGECRNFTLTEKVCQIENLRGKESAYNIDHAGFQFVKHKSNHTKFIDDKEIIREYYPESIALIKKVTGAERVIIYDHTIRRHRPGVPDTSEDTRAPLFRIHVDQSPAAAAARVKKHASSLADELLKHRYQIINLWRPINNPAIEYPLALCDYRSVNWNSDLVFTTLKHSDREDGEVFNVNYNPDHKWKYLRGMTTEEALLFKCFDSKMDGSVAILVPHTSFVDTTTPKDAPHRESIELRALVFYNDLSN